MLTEATTPPLDLLLVGGAVVDPSQGLHARKDVGLAQGRVALVADSIPAARARHVVDCSSLIVTPAAGGPACPRLGAHRTTVSRSTRPAWQEEPQPS